MEWFSSFLGVYMWNITGLGSLELLVALNFAIAFHGVSSSQLYKIILFRRFSKRLNFEKIQRKIIYLGNVLAFSWYVLVFTPFWRGRTMQKSTSVLPGWCSLCMRLVIQTPRGWCQPHSQEMSTRLFASFSRITNIGCRVGTDLIVFGSYWWLRSAKHINKASLLC